MKRLISPDIKVLSGPLFTVILATSLIVAGANIGYESVTTRIESYKAQKNSERALEAKLDILKGVEQGSLQRSNRLAQILPESHPGSAAISQLKLKTQENLVSLAKVELKNENPYSDNITATDFVFEGSSESMLNIINNVEALAKTGPLIGLKKLDIDAGLDGFFDARVESQVFWSPYPDNIATVGTQIFDLSEDERIMMNDLEEFLLPARSELNPIPPTDRENPFN